MTDPRKVILGVLAVVATYTGGAFALGRYAGIVIGLSAIGLLAARNHPGALEGWSGVWAATFVGVTGLMTIFDTVGFAVGYAAVAATALIVPPMLLHRGYGAVRARWSA
jgi:hypothetical protein